MHRFRFNELFTLAGNDVIAISSLGGASGNFWLQILKGWPRLYIHVHLTLFVYLERFGQYSTFLFGWDFHTGGEIWGFWGKWPPKRQMREKHRLGEHSLTPNCVFWAIVREIISIRLACAGAKKKAGRRVTRSVYFTYAYVERPLAGGFQPNLLKNCVQRPLAEKSRWRHIRLAIKPRYLGNHASKIKSYFQSIFRFGLPVLSLSHIILLYCLCFIGRWFPVGKHTFFNLSAWTNH